MDVGDNEVKLQFDGDKVIRIVMRLTDAAAIPKAAESKEFIQNSFADLAATATEVLGRPAARLPGRNPQVRWRNDSTTLSLITAGPSVNLVWATNADQDHWDRI